MALLTWRILILLRVVAQIHKRPPKFTQEWFKTFALHTTLYVFMWVVPVSGFFSTPKATTCASSDYSTRPVSANSTMVELGRSLHFWLAYTFGVHLPACFGSLEGCSG